MARELLEHLYNQNADDVISAAFDRFAAVFSTDNEAMGMAYMAEVNLGMAGLSSVARPDRRRRGALSGISLIWAATSGAVFTTRSATPSRRSAGRRTPRPPTRRLSPIPRSPMRRT